jgi:Family of unknown function (DUF6088)
LNLSNFFAIKLDKIRQFIDNHNYKPNEGAMSITKTIQKHIESSGERVWRLSDFEKMPPMAAAQALSRLSRKGLIIRLGKGLYYHPRQTKFGQSKPNPNQLRSLIINKKGIFPAGAMAANLLGFSTQNSARVEVATNGLSLPRLIVGKETIIHTRRPDSWQSLSEKEAAILDFLRNHGMFSELSSKDTVLKLLEHFKELGCFENLFRVVFSEPPRVRAMLGAIGQEMGCSENQLGVLKKTLNPLSRFDFGSLTKLKFAKQWQAKQGKICEII